MKAINPGLLSLTLGIFVITVFVMNSNAQEENNDLVSEKTTFVFVQTLLENSNGDYVTYLTSDKFTDLDRQRLEILLDSEVTENDPIIEIDGQDYQVIKRKLSISYEQENVIASTILARTGTEGLVHVARFAHDGYPIVPGDTVHSIWTFVKPLE